MRSNNSPLKRFYHRPLQHQGIDCPLLQVDYFCVCHFLICCLIVNLNYSKFCIWIVREKMKKNLSVLIWWGVVFIMICEFASNDGICFVMKLQLLTHLEFFCYVKKTVIVRKPKEFTPIWYEYFVMKLYLTVGVVMTSAWVNILLWNWIWNLNMLICYILIIS